MTSVPSTPSWASIGDVILGRREADGGKPAVTYRAAGDRFLLVEYGETVFDLTLNFFAQSVLGYIAEHPIAGVVETMPGFRSVGFSVDATRLRHRDLIAELERIIDAMPPVDGLVLPSRTVVLPAAIADSESERAVERYLQTIKPDAVNCAGGNNIDYTLQYNGIDSVEALTEHITSTDLWVGFVGFFPGLPFMFPLDPRNVLFAPKYNPTRTWTPEGAIGLGGPCYSIYPVESPGGYQLLGRTIPVYDMQQRNAVFADDPILLRTGDRVRFEAVDEAEVTDTFKAVHADRYEYRVEEGVFSVSEFLEWSAELEEPASRWRDHRDAAAAATPVP
ncbi:Allophanate hydrolase subunit 1 [Agreia bicolorata]|uniref:Allophanate hydrolase subunit 1 n=1 Tax=Agreia bicolorata TaxID=110935 RepID=A0A1T4WS15_9MICO|nr:carboxyltransferase domain-containing protein [Agreia bicolorata]SKA79411.1 Allophanate hydrolase subunit 1 [Agreia bicolorata]